MSDIVFTDSGGGKPGGTGRLVRLLSELGAVVIIALILLFNSVYTVAEQEKAVITQFGKAIAVEGAGLHFKIPFIQDVQWVKMTTQGMEVGWNSASDAFVDAESFMITKDFNFINCDFYVEWKVSDPIKYRYNSKDPKGLLRSIMQAEARSVVSSYGVDDVLTTAKFEIQTRVKEGVVAKVEEYQLGILVSNVSIQDVEPPTLDVISAFKDVENAKQNKETEINGANKYQNEVLPKAAADADRIVKEAEAVKEARINEAAGQVARFNEIYAEYARNKDITRTRMYLEAMEEILPGVKVIVSDPSDGGILKMMQLDDGSVNSGASGVTTVFTEGGGE